eukprot:410827-Prymnesium_polylepis.7
MRERLAEEVPNGSVLVHSGLQVAELWIVRVIEHRHMTTLPALLVEARRYRSTRSDAVGPNLKLEFDGPTVR